MREFQSLSRGKRYLVLCLIALLILSLVVGFYSLEQIVFAHSPSLAVASPTTQGTTTVSSPTAISSPGATSSPTATPLPTTRTQPTATPTPKAQPSPAILAVTPNTYYVNTCTPSGRASYNCTFTLRNSSSTSTLAWTGKASNSHGLDATGYLSATSGTIPQSGTTTVSLFLTGETGVCSVIGTTVYLQFTGPANSVTVTVTC